jgi:hypothetical protein
LSLLAVSLTLFGGWFLFAMILVSEKSPPHGDRGHIVYACMMATSATIPFAIVGTCAVCFSHFRDRDSGDG